MQLPLLYPPHKETSPTLGQLHVDPGVCESVSCQQLRHSGLDELRRRPDAEHSGFAAGEGPGTLPQRFGIGHKPSSPLQDFLAIPCEDDAAPDAVEQSAGELVFEILDLPR